MTEARAEDASQARLVYVLYLVGLVFPVTVIVGLVWAYVVRAESVDWLRTHYRYQIRTFWLGLLYGVVGLALVVVGIGVLLLLAELVWWIVRCVKGLRQLERRQAVENVETWLF